MARKIVIFMIAYFLYVPLLFGGIAAGVVFADGYVDTAENPVPAFVMLLLLIVLMAGPIVWFCLTWNRPSKLDRALQITGKRAMARILNVEDTGVSSGKGLTIYVRLTLEVQPDAGEPFQAKLETANSRVSILRPGETLFVRYDPAHPEHVVLDEGPDEAATSLSASETPFGTPMTFDSAISAVGALPGLADRLNTAFQQMASGQMHSGVYVLGADGKAVPQGAPTPSEPDLLAQLKGLDELHRSSALTDAEYEAAKKKLLA